MTAKELYGITRRRGASDAILHHKNVQNDRNDPLFNPDYTIEQARRAPLDVLRKFFEQARDPNLGNLSIPEMARFKPYRIGWRGPYTVTHGTTSGYSMGCRCGDCRQAATKYHKERRKKVREANKEAEMAKYRQGTALALAEGVMDMMQEEQSKRMANGTFNEDAHRFASMNALVEGYPEDTPIPQKLINMWYVLCAVKKAADKNAWLMQAPIEVRVDEKGNEQFYRKTVKENA